MSSLDLTSFKALSFDIFGTLIDWDLGISQSLLTLLRRLPPTHPERNNSSEESQRKFLITIFTAAETSLIKAYPKMLYTEVLAKTYHNVAAELGVSSTEEEETAFGGSIGSFPAFPDTVAAMHELAKHYKLIALSNIDRVSFTQTINGPLHGVPFSAKYIAEDIGTYKPDLNNFEYLIQHAKEDLGVEKDQILHVAHGLPSDHVPALQIGLRPSVWIVRGEGAERADGLEKEGKIRLGGRFETLGDLAKEMGKQFGGK